MPPGTEFGEHVEFKGASANLSHVVIFSEVPLTAETPEKHQTVGGGLYEWAGGQLQLVSLLPNEQQESGAFLGDKVSYDARGAVSSDGSRIVWTTARHELFMRDVSIEHTVRLDAVQGGSGGESEAQFQFASNDGSTVFFTDEAQLTKQSSATSGEPDLYECEMVEAMRVHWNAS